MRRYHVDDVALYQSGRAALFALLSAYGIGKGDHVIVQAFTCVAVANSILWAGATPIYADIDDSLNMDPNDLAKKITPNTKAIIVQHTFGIPADMGEIRRIAKKHKIIVIEDCAHALGATYAGKPVGSLADAAFFSFGRDKAVSSVWGGAAIIHPTAGNRHVRERLLTSNRALPQPSYFWIAQQVLHPIAFSMILPTYTTGFGKLLLVLLQSLRLLSKPVASEELVGRMPPHIMAAYPNALAAMLLVQLAKIDAMIARRTRIASAYGEKLSKKFTRVSVRSGASYLRLPVLVDAPVTYIRRAKTQGILLGNWYHHIIDPAGTDFAAIGFSPESCPRAQYAAAHILNFPTLIADADAAAVLDAVK